MLRKLFIGVIKFYQRFVSPHKGFRCAYSVYHQTNSCSVAAIDILQQNQSIINGVQQVRERLMACRQANVALQMLREKEEENRKKSNVCADSLQGVDCIGNSCNFIDGSCFDGCGGIDSCSCS